MRFRRRKRIWTVDFGPRGQISTSNPALAAVFLERRVIELELDLGHRESIQELQSRTVDTLRARATTAERMTAEYRDHLTERTSQLRELESRLGHIVAPFQPDGEMMPSDYAERVAVVLSYWIGKARFAEQELAAQP